MLGKVRAVRVKSGQFKIRSDNVKVRSGRIGTDHASSAHVKSSQCQLRA